MADSRRSADPLPKPGPEPISHILGSDWLERPLPGNGLSMTSFIFRFKIDQGISTGEKEEESRDGF